VGVLEVGAKEVLGLDVAGARGPARADGSEFAGVLEGFGAVEVLGECGEGKEEEGDEDH
jgi:hypothetical protein